MSIICSQRVLTIEQTFKVSSPYSVTLFSLEGFIPRTIPDRQRVIDIRFSDSRIQKVHYDDYDLFRVVINGPVNSFIEIEYDIELYDYDLDRVKRVDNRLRNSRLDDKDRYLKANHFHRKNSRMANSVSEKISGKTDLETVSKIFDFVVDHMEYDDGLLEDLGSNYALKKGKGDCTEYADLMVALCKAEGIAARVISGMIAGAGQNINHNWCEVFLMDYGWVPFDPTLADTGDRTTFENLSNIYVYFDRGRTNEQLGSSMWRWKSENGVASVYPNYLTDWSVRNKFALAYKAYNSADYEKALGFLAELLQFDPKNINFLIFKAMILARTGKLEVAEQVFQYVLRNSTHWDEKMNGFWSYANLLSLKGDYEGTLKYINMAIDYGFDNLEQIDTDEDLVGFRASKFYKRIQERLN